MSEQSENEVDDLVGGLNDEDGDEGSDDNSQSSDSEGEKPRKKRVRRTRKASSKKSDDGEKKESQKTMEELDAEQMLPRKLPKPVENVKTLGDLCAKYEIGDSPEFKLQVYRTYPKMFPGAMKADGFYDTWNEPLDMEMIQSEYGGGTYRVVVVGPHPKSPNLPKHYDSISVQIPGHPNYERLPKAMQGKEHANDDKQTGGQQPQYPPQMPTPAENPKLVESAMKMAFDQAKLEREERREMERRSEERERERQQQAQQQPQYDPSKFYEPVVDAERRRADDLLRSERERNEAERRFMQERLEEEKRNREEFQRKVETEQNSKRSLAQEITDLKEAGIFKTGDEGIAQSMLNQILEKHRSEMDGLQQQHREFIKSLREGHQSELQALRESHRRELEAEREASRNREQRIEERLNSEREERKRDQDRAREQMNEREQRYRETLAERDQQWKDRMDQQQQMLNQSWESRHNALISSYENRIQWQQGEIDRLKTELAEAKHRQNEERDPVAQLHRFSEMKNVFKDTFKDELPQQSSGASSGGIGLSGSGGEDWKTALAEGMSERIPDIIKSVAGGFAGAGGAQQQQAAQNYEVGQEVDTPQGKMIVVQTPDGQKGLAPKEQVEAYQRAQMQQQEQQQASGRLLGQQQQQQQQRPQPRVMPSPEKVRQSRRRASASINATQNLADGLPKPKPPWEGGIDSSEPQRSAARTSHRSEPSGEQEQHSGGEEPMELSRQERQGLNMIAKLVHESVMQADEPEEFVDKVQQGFPPDLLQYIVGTYTTDQILRGIRQVQPKSAGAKTPAGQEFVRSSFRKLREALSSE